MLIFLCVKRLVEKKSFENSEAYLTSVLVLLYARHKEEQEKYKKILDQIEFDIASFCEYYIFTVTLINNTT